MGIEKYSSNENPFFTWVNKKIKVKQWHFIAELILFFNACVITFLGQYILIDTKQEFLLLSRWQWFINIVAAFTILLFVHIITHQIGVTLGSVNTLILLWLLIDDIVFQCRGSEFEFTDLPNVKTALSVVAEYHIVINKKWILAVVICMMIGIFARKIEIIPPKSKKKFWLQKGVCTVMMICFMSLIQTSISSWKVNHWAKSGTINNGFLCNMLLRIEKLKIEVPEGYSKETAEQILAEYEKTSKACTEGEVKEPTIIVIMNEAFADLSVLGEFETSQEVMPFFNGMRENVVKGYALSSVFGGSTANSEWEYLTGNSVGFLPDGAIAYTQYVNEESKSLVSRLKDLGYTCVGMHPYHASGWRRSTVYPALGFDEVHFLEDFDQSHCIRNYVSDETFYSRIISRYEEKAKDEKLFLFGVTMQNHGGYSRKYSNFTGEVAIEGLQNFTVDQYLSLIHESDRALEKLITYFKQEDEPVEIVYFGDHQPSLPRAFYQYARGNEEAAYYNRYEIPFFIWTNYSTETDYMPLTSINNLSTITLERANITLNGYEQFHAKMMEKIPALHAQGYYSLEGGYKRIDEAEGEEAALIHQYHMLQYYHMITK